MKKTILLTFAFALIFFGAAAQDTKKMIDKAYNLQLKEKFDDAIKIYDKILASEPQNAQAYNGKANCISEKNPTEAEKLYKEAIKLDPNYASPYYNLGLMSYYQERNFPKARSNFQKAFELSPDSAVYAMFIGMTFAQQNQFEEALTLYNKSIDIEPLKFQPYYYKATLYYNIDSVNLALETINTALDKGAKLGYFYTFRADIFSQLENYEQAILDCNKAIETNEEDIFAYQLRAQAYFMLYNSKKAIADCEKILKIEPEDMGAIYLLSNIYVQTEEYEKAISTAEKGLQINPYHDQLFQVISISSFKIGNFEDAKIAADKALYINPNDLTSIDYFIFSELHLNTNENVYDLQTRKFNDLKVENYAEMIKKVKNKKDKYSYKKLSKKFGRDRNSLSLDEYLMFYLGHSQQKKFSGYAQSKKTEYRKHFALGDYPECINSAQKLLANDPLLIEAYMYIAYAYAYMGNLKQYRENMQTYLSIVHAIEMSGDGETPETAFITISVADEYNMMYYLNYRYGSQALRNINGHNYDTFEVVDKFGNKSELYFLIDPFFGKK